MANERRLRLAVTGRNGQVTRALQDRAGPDFDVLAVGRPELDLASGEDLQALFGALQADAIVNAAAYTAVDKAESEWDLALAINAKGTARVAHAAAMLGIPIIQLSTDYVFDGTSSRPYREEDQTAPVNHYGASKLAGEDAIRAATAKHVILRTSWVYAPQGQNFLRTMLRLAETRDEIRVVADQIGAPTSALSIAAAIEKIARNLKDHPDQDRLYGLFHLTDGGETSWAGFAEEIFRLSKSQGGPAARVIPITTAEYPTLARRPASSRLDLTKIGAEHSIVTPHWTEALRAAMAALAMDPSLTPPEQRLHLEG
jgi:dTDP-4-dehydrorhamnose reductase